MRAPALRSMTSFPKRSGSLHKGWISGVAVACILGSAVLSSCDQQNRPVPLSNETHPRVPILESPHPRWVGGAGWKVDAEPSLDLAERTGDPNHSFFMVADMATLDDGSIAVALPSEIRLFASDGRYLRTIGRRGEGPGEFTHLSDLEVAPGDTLLAFDYSQLRVSIYTPSRELGRIVTLRLALAEQDFHAIPGGGFVVVSERPRWTESSARVGLARGEQAIVVLDSEGQVVDTIASVPGTETVLSAGEGGWQESLPLFGRSTHLALQRDRLLVATGDSPGYRILDLQGTLKQRVARTASDLNLGDDLVGAERALRLEINPSRAMRREIERLPVPDTRPTVADIQVDETGSVWLAEHRGEFRNLFSHEPRTWNVFDSKGAWLGEVSMPGRFTVFEIGLDHILGVWRDQLNVEHPQRLRLHR